MAWVRIDAHVDEHPKLVQGGPLGWAMWMAGLAYCNRNLSDGFMPWGMGQRLVPSRCTGSQRSDDRQKLYSVSISCGMQGDDVTAEFVVDVLLNAELCEEVDRGYHVVPSTHWEFERDPGAQELRDSRGYRDWRAAVIERDGKICQHCGVRTEYAPLHEHHIQPFAEYPELRTDFGHGVTLCAECHGRDYGRKLV